MFCGYLRSSALVFVMAVLLLSSCGKDGGEASSSITGNVEGKWQALQMKFTQGPLANQTVPLAEGGATVSLNGGNFLGYYYGREVKSKYRVDNGTLVRMEENGTEIGRAKILALTQDFLQIEGENKEIIDYKRVTDEQFAILVQKGRDAAAPGLGLGLWKMSQN